MTEKFDLGWIDMTPEAQKRFKAFVGEDWKDEMTDKPIFGMSKERMERKKEQIGHIEDLIKSIMGNLSSDTNEDTYKGVPRKVLDEALSRMKNGDDVAGIILDKETGEYRFLTQAESDEVAKREDVGTIDMNDPDCDCPECQARRAGEKAHPRKWN